MSDELPQGKENEVPLVLLERLNQRLKTIVEDATQDKPIRVRGVATDVSRTRSGHVHLRLGRSSMAWVVFRSVVQKQQFSF